MQMAMAVGECTGEDADLLRRAMGSKRGIERIESLKEKLYAGMATNGLVGRGGRRHLRADPGVRELRLRRVALAVVRAARLRELVDQAALPRRLPRGAAARAADGLLLARDPHRRRPPARRRGAAPRPAALGGGGGARAGGLRQRKTDPGVEQAEGETTRLRPRLLHPPQPATGRRSSTAPNPTSPRPTAATGGSRCDWGWPRSRASETPSPTASSPSARAPATTATCAIWCAAPGSRRRSSRRSRPRGRSSASGSAAGRRSGSPARPRRTASSSCPIRSRSCSRRCSPTRRATSGSRATCGRPASPPTTTR